MEVLEGGIPGLREGRDFANADELRALAGDVPARAVRRGAGERLAEAIAQEVRWLRETGETPGGLPWDMQPAWRVRLWEHLIDEQERVAMVTSLMR